MGQRLALRHESREAVAYPWSRSGRAKFDIAAAGAGFCGGAAMTDREGVKLVVVPEEHRVSQVLDVESQDFSLHVEPGVECVGQLPTGGSNRRTLVLGDARVSQVVGLGDRAGDR